MNRNIGHILQHINLHADAAAGLKRIMRAAPHNYNSPITLLFLERQPPFPTKKQPSQIHQAVCLLLYMSVAPTSPSAC